MNPEEYARHQGKVGLVGGLPSVVLLTDPAADGDTFLSVVDKGANLRKISVTKADGAVLVAPEFEETPGGWLQRLLAPLMALFAGTVSKSEPTTFDAAIAIPNLYDMLWKAHDALNTTIRGILESDEVANKAAAVELALQQFAAHVAGEFRRLPVAKADQAAAISAASREHVAKAGKMISRANETKIRAALDALQALLTAAGLTDDTATKAATAVTTTPNDEAPTTMTPEQLQAVATAAANNAITVAKTANPALTPAQLQAIGVAASNDVFKMAVSGPAQPAMPQDALARQMAMYGAMTPGGAPDPSALFAGALGGLGETVTKAVEQAVKPIRDEVAKVTKELFGEGEGDKRTPGLRDVVAKQHEVLGKLRQTTTPPKATDTDAAARERATKGKADGGDDVDWSGSGLELPGE